MSDTRIVVIEVSAFEPLLREIIREELASFFASKQEALLKKECLYANHIAKILKVSKQTVYNYWKRGDLPEPKRNISGRAYWTPEDLENILKHQGLKTKFNVFD